MTISVRWAHPARKLFRRPWQPLFIAAVIGLASSASGILGAAVWTIFAHPLPFVDPERLVVIRGSTDLLSKTEVDRLRGERSLSRVASFRQSEAQRRTDGAAEEVSTAAVDSNFFPLLGVHASSGRLLLDDDFRTTASVGAVIGEDFAIRHGGAKALLGRPLTLDAETFIVVGVAPAALQLPRNVDVWLPDRRTASAYDAPQYWALGRLAPLASIAGLRAESEVSGPESPRDAGRQLRARIHVEDAASFVRAEAGSGFLAALVAVSAIVLLTLGTLASLFTARLIARTHVVAIQRALGASTAALFREYLSEIVVIGILGILFGLAAAAGGLRVLDARSAIRDWWPTGLYLSLGVVCGVILSGSTFSLFLAGIQALHVSRLERGATLLQSAGAATPGRSARSWRAVLLGSEIALVMCLLVMSGVLVRAFLEWDDLPWGYDVDHIGFAVVDLPQAEFRSPAARADVAKRLRNAMHHAPNLALSTVFGLSLPMWTSEKASYVELDGAGNYDRATSRFGPAAPQSIMDVDPSYFSVFQIPLVRGRSITARDGATTEPVIVVDETIAKRNWPGADPIGHLMRFPAMEPNGPRYRVVGVVKNALPVSPSAPLVAHGSIRIGVAYRSLAQVAAQWPDHGDPRRAGVAIAFRLPNNRSSAWAELRATFASVVADQPIEHLGTLRAYYQSGVASESFERALLLGAAAAFGLLLSLAGIVALVTEAVSRRTREIGIRVALGAPRAHILALAIESTSAVACIGVCAGLILALVLSNVFGHYIFGIGRGVDETGLLFATSTGLLIVVIASSMVPAMRALRISPADALRAE